MKQRLIQFITWNEQCTVYRTQVYYQFFKSKCSFTTSALSLCAYFTLHTMFHMHFTNQTSSPEVTNANLVIISRTIYMRTEMLYFQHILNDNPPIWPEIFTLQCKQFWALICNFGLLCSSGIYLYLRQIEKKRKNWKPFKNKLWWLSITRIHVQDNIAIQEQHTLVNL